MKRSESAFVALHARVLRGMRASGMCVNLFTYILAYSLVSLMCTFPYFCSRLIFFRTIVCVWQVELFLLNEGGGVASRYK
jgi:hypothetical protein